MLVGFSAHAQLVVKDEGTQLGAVSAVNCSGTGVTCTRTGSTWTLSASASSGVSTPHFRAHRSTTLNVPHNTSTVVVCDTETWDTDNIHNAATGRITIPTTGYYRISISAHYTVMTGERLMITYVRKNAGLGTQADLVYKYGHHYTAAGNPYDQVTETKTDVLYLASGDTLDLTVYQIHTGGLAGTLGAGHETAWEVQRVR